MAVPIPKLPDQLTGRSVAQFGPTPTGLTQPVFWFGWIETIQVQIMLGIRSLDPLESQKDV